LCNCHALYDKRITKIQHFEEVSPFSGTFWAFLSFKIVKVSVDLILFGQKWPNFKMRNAIELKFNLSTFCFITLLKIMGISVSGNLG
jgi:hypothetical protein